MSRVVYPPFGSASRAEHEQILRDRSRRLRPRRVRAWTVYLLQGVAVSLACCGFVAALMFAYLAATGGWMWLHP